MEDALRAVRLLNSQQVEATLDFLGENVTDRREAENARDEYLHLLEAIAREHVRSNVSLKVTQMGIDVDEGLCFESVAAILAKASQFGNFVRIDMESSNYTERTLRIFERLFSLFPNVGIVIQAYLHRSEKDARHLAELRAPVRVCKGAYKESSAVAFQPMGDIRRSYKQLVEILLTAGSKVGIATHDESLIRWALQWTSGHSIPREQFEFQMLYGLRRARGRDLAAQGFTVRSYVPYGTHWLPYFVRRLRERKENIFFVLRSLVAD